MDEVAILFNLQDGARDEWLNDLGISAKNVNELAAMYERAKPYLLQYKDALLSLPLAASFKFSSEEAIDPDVPLLFALYEERVLNTSLALPSDFVTIVDYDETFYDFYGQCVKRSTVGDKAYYIDAPAPAVDIFFILQTICAGGLLLNCSTDPDAATSSGAFESGHPSGDYAFRCLPNKEWVQNHREMLARILDDEVYHHEIVKASENSVVRIPYPFGDETMQMDPSAKDSDEEYLQDDDGYGGDYEMYGHDNDDDYYINRWGMREPKDYTACDKECGYCGRCEY